MKQIYSIYYIRMLAIILIVNSHFNIKRIPDFEPFALYGYLGNYGNLIFFFISSYILTLGFKKYEDQILRWVCYRLLYLIVIILSLRIVFNILQAKLPNPFIMLVNLFNSLDFIASMLYLSMLFPVLYHISKKKRLALLTIFSLTALTCYAVIPKDILEFMEYTTIFILGVAVAKNEVAILFKRQYQLLTLLIISLSIFLFTKIKFNYYPLATLSKMTSIFFIFHFSESVEWGKFPGLLNRIVIEVAKLSLYIYLTHFYFVNYAYHISRRFGLLIIFLIVIPICYAEYLLINPAVVYLKKRIIK